MIDPGIQARRGSGETDATIEIGRAATVRGTVVRLRGQVSGQQVRHVLELAFDRAGRFAVGGVSDPGWWASVVSWAAIESGLQACVPRPSSSTRSARHAIVVVEPSRMLEPAPEWPLVRLSPTAPWLDLRGETALRHGPADSELTAYSMRADVALDAASLRRMFDQGVLEWGDLPKSGRRRVRHAGS